VSAQKLPPSPPRICESKMELENTDLEVAVENTTGLKQLVVNYIGNRLVATEEVTVDMAVEVFAAEFPEFLMAIAEENFLRGYQQALDDLAPENNSNE